MKNLLSFRSSLCIAFLMVSGGLLLTADDSTGGRDESYFWDNPLEIEVKGTDMAFTDEIFTNVRNQNIFFMTRFNNGWVFMTSYFGFRTRSGFIDRWGIYVVVTDPEGNQHFTTHEIKRRDIRFAGNRLYITDGQNSIEGGGMYYRVKYDMPGFSCDLVYRNILPPWKPGDGMEYFSDDGEVYEMRTVNCPWADVTGTMTVDGDEMNVVGEGYSEFSLLIIPFRFMNPALHAIRVFSPDGTPKDERWHLGILDYINHDHWGGDRFPRLILGHGNEFVITTKDYTIQELDWAPAPGTPWEFPRRLEISYRKNGYVFEGTYRSHMIFNITDIFDEIPEFIQEFLLLFMSRPVYIRNLGEFEGSLITPDGRLHRLHLYGPYEYLLTK